MKRALGLLLAGSLVVAAGACDDRGMGDDQSAEPTETTRAGSCVGAATATAEVGRLLPEPLAEVLPRPPDGARLCRVDPTTRTIEFRTVRTSAEALFEYYRPVLRDAGCSTDEIEPPSGTLSGRGDRSLPFSCDGGKGSLVASERGTAYSIAWSSSG